MTVKTPIKATFTGSDVTGLAEFQSADFIGVIDGGTGAVTLTSNSILLGNGTDAIQSSPIQISGSTISASDSTLITIDDGLSITGDLTVTGTITGAISGATTSGNIQVGVTGNNEIDTSSGNLTLDSAGGTIAVDDNLTVSGNTTITGNLTVDGTTTTVNSTTIEITNSFTFEGSTPDGFETTLGVIDPTADRTINLPNASGTIVLQDTTDTLTNKTINSASNTITITESNISDLQSYILANSTDTLTNKTIDADNNTITNIGDSELSSGISATKIGNGDVDNTELSYLNGVTSAIQTQLDSKATNAFAIAQAVALG
jgi:hypothetical protein